MEEVREEKFLDRLLYRNYHSGSSAGYFVRQRVRPTAWLLMAILMLSMVMGANLDRSVVVVVSVILFSSLIVAFVWTLFRNGKVRAVRELPETGSVGERIRYVVRVLNLGKGELREVLFHDIDDDPRPTLWEFIHLKEPGEDRRNIFDRTFGFYRWKWLNERGGRWESHRTRTPVDLPARESRAITLTVTPKRRGVLRLEDLRICLPDPLGLFQRVIPAEAEGDEVLVIPRRYRLPAIELQGDSDLKIGGETASTIRGEGGEFMGLREYQPGDSLRKIHWKAWARTGTPIVKEYEEVRFPRYGLILDTSFEESGPELFEEAVSVAASFVSTMDREQCLLDLMFVRDEPVVYTAGRGVEKTSRLMEVLARVEGSDEGGYESLTRLIRQYAAEMTAGVVVLAGWSAARREFLEGLAALRLRTRVLVVGVGEGRPPDLPREAHWLRWNEVEEDLMKIR